MNCNNCGGRLSFVNGVYRCDNCGATFSLQDVYEKVDVCICYQENDENGRRTKDSIISQDIYKKLEANKINTYYSRISAGEIIGSDLERATFAAICAAKVIVIVGTTKNRFDATYHMYVEQHTGKIIIPVFSEMNPYDIPKNISAIQALDFNKIGADIDLIKGVLNALGRRKDAEQIGVNKDRTKKGKKTIIIAVAALIVFLLAFFLLYEITAPKSSTDGAIEQTESVTDETSQETQETEKVLTQLDQYNSAITYLENGKLSEALSVFVELSGYKDSDKQRQLIFEKYSGYYKTNDISFHLQTYGDFVANIELSFLINGNIVKITESLQLEAQEKNFEFIDSENNFGNITIKFTNDGVVVMVTSTQTSSDLFIGDQEILFSLAEKSDKPIINLRAETILSWVKKPTTIEDVRRLGYEVALEYSSARMNMYEEYGIKNTDVKLESLWETTYITSILAPAEMLIPDYIGKPGNEFYIDDVLVISNATAYGNSFVQHGWDNDDIITKDTPVLVITEVSFNTAVDDAGWEATFDEFYRTIVQFSIESEVKSKYKIDSASANIVTQNDTHILFSVKISNDRCAWYKYDKKSQKATFVKDGPYQADGWKISKTLWFSEYLDFAQEFPYLFDVAPGSNEWNDLVEDLIYDKVCDAIRERYPQEDGSVSYGKLAKNNTYILIYAQTESLRQANKCAWYKGNIEDGRITFVKEGVYVDDYFGLSKHLWFKEYPDLAKEFPNAYDTNIADLPYLQDLPYSITVNNNYHAIHTAPSDEYVKRDDEGFTIYLDEGTYIIVEEEYDEEYNLWGKLESGEGWVCLSSIF